ncbi:hypothetical protein K439DRAFT_1632353 [Ramaria rubella]|nr:hypothetical protein K439DRAFT_1632353 [Ramaria rubella]
MSLVPQLVGSSSGGKILNGPPSSNVAVPIGNSAPNAIVIHPALPISSMKRTSETLSHPYVSYNAKRPRVVDTSSGSSRPPREQEDILIRKEDSTKRTEGYYARSQHEKIQAENAACLQQLEVLHQKMKYLDAKLELLHVLSEIHSIECEGGLSPKKPFFRDWISKYDSDDEDDFATKYEKLERDLLVLRRYRSELRDKKRYRDQKIFEGNIGAGTT